MTPSQKNPARTEKKEGSGKLSQFEKRILDTSSIGVLITRISDGTILYANKAIAGLLEAKDADSLIGRLTPDFYWDPRDRQAILERFRAEGFATENELRARRPNGKMAWISISLQSFNLEGEQVLLSEITDITSRKQAERELLLRDRALASSLNGVVILNIQDNKPIYVNDAALKMTGYTREEILQLGLPDITGNPAEPQKIRAAIQTQGFFVGEELIKRKDGSVFPTNFFSSLITDEKGQPFAVQSNFFDITERKQAEEALRESQLLYQSLVEVSPLSVCRKDLEGRFTFANQRFLELSHTTLNDLVGKTDFDLHPSELAEKYRRDDLTVMESGQAEEIIEERIIQEGKISIVQTIKAPVYDGDGKINGIQISFWDITDRKQAEQARQESEERFRSLYNNSTIGLYRTTPDGRILMINPTGLRLLGFDSFEELAKRNLEEAGFEEQDARRKFRERLEREGVIEQESVWTRKDGTPIFVREGATVSRDENGNVLYYDGSFEDITAQKQAQESLRISEERYQTIFNSSPVMFWLKDTKNNMIQINQAAAAFENVKPEDMAGRSSYDVYPREQAEAFYQDDLQVIRSGKPKLGIVEKHTSPGSGNATWLETGKVPIRNNTGEITGVLAFAVDITEREKAAEELRRIQTTVETAPDFIAMATPDGTGVYINPAGLEMVGYTSEEFYAGMKIAAVQPDIPPQVFETVMREGIWRGESEFVRKDGSRFPISQAISAYKDKQGQVQQIITIARDITEQKKAEQLLQQSEVNLSSALRVANMGYWEFDIPTQMFTFNDQYYSLHGTTAQEVGGYQISVQRFAQEFVHPEDAASVGLSTQQAIETTDPDFQIQIEARILRKDGGIRWVTVWFRVEKDEQGRTVKLHGVNQDITERKQAEESLRESEERFRRFTEATVEGLVFHEQGRIVDVNPAVVTIFGYSDMKELIGRNLLEFIVPELRELVLQKMQSETVLPYEIQGIHKDGTIFPVETSTRVYTLGDHVIRASSIRDITERKQAESELQQEKAFSDAVINGLPGVFFLFDPQGNRVRWNKEYERVLGYTAEELAVAKSVDVIAEEDREKTVAEIQRAFREGRGSIESTLVTKDGRRIPYQYIAQRLQLGDQLYVAGTGMDITERKRAETALQQEKIFSDAVINGLPGVFFLFDPQGKMVRWNEEYEKVLGYTAEETAIRNALDPIADEDKEFTAAAIGRAFTEGQSSVEAHFVTRSGDHIPYQFIGRRLQLGDQLYLAGTGLDITERKRLESESNRLASILESTTELVGIADMERRLVYMNLAGRRMLGIGDDEDISALHSFDLTPPAVREDSAKAMSTVMQVGSWSGESIMLARDGREIPVWQVAVVQRAANGAPQNLSIIAHDITESKRAEAQIERALRETRVRYEVSQALAGAQTEDDVLDALEQHAGLLYPEAMVMLVTFDRQGEDVALTLRRGNGFESGMVFNTPLGLRFTADRFPVLKMLSSDKPFITNDFLADHERFGDPDALKAVQQLGAASIAYFPMTVGSEWMGFVNVVVKSAGYFDETRQYLYQALAELGATALQTARLRDQIRDAMTRRGYQVQVSTQISQEVASASGLKELFERVVTLTKERLGYYHTQLLRYDVIQDAVVLIHGYGETGQKMLEDGHKMPMGSGLIGAAAATGETMLRPTLADDLTWQPNPLLPDTKGEIAVPIKFGDQVLGVLDVQSDKAGALTEDDRLLLEGLCGQIAVAMEQTRLRTEMAERLEEVNRLYRTMSREGWKTYRETTELPNGFVFDQAGVRPVKEVTLDTETFTSIPMKVLGGEVVGNLAIANDPQRPMSLEDLTFLQQVSDQVALALEGARLTAQTQFALEQSEKLFDASRSLAQASDLQELVKTAVETINIPVVNRAGLETFNYDADGELEGMTLVANWWNGVGHKGDEVGHYVTANVLKAISLFLSPTPLFFSDTFHDERLDPATMQMVKALNYRAFAVLPLFQGTRQLGLMILTAEEPHNFTEDETRLFSALAPQIVTVMENRRQFERAQQQAEREGMLNIISQKIQSATTVEDVLQVAARELGHALGAPMTIARLNLKGK